MEVGLIDDEGRYRLKGVGVASGDDKIHYAPPAERVPHLIQDYLTGWRKQMNIP